MTGVDQVALHGPPRDWHTVDLNWFRTELQEQRRIRLDQLIDLAYQALSDSDDAVNGVTATLMRTCRAALTDIDAALFRLAIGRFGECQRCGRAIPPDRLYAIPTAGLCLRCELSTESEHPRLLPWRTGTIPPASPSGRPRDIVEVWGEDSFPASDPPANW